MLGSWYKRQFSRLVTDYWPVVIAGWICLAATLNWLSPAWDDIAADGNLAFLPPEVPSAVGQRALEEAFPGSQVRSQLVVIFSSTGQPKSGQALSTSDLAMALDFSRRLHWWTAKAVWRKLQPQLTNLDLSDASQEISEVQRAELELILANLSEAILIEEHLFDFLVEEQRDELMLRLPDAHQIRGALLERIQGQEEAALDRATAELIREQPRLLDADPPDWTGALRNVWSWRSPIIGNKLGSNHRQARLVQLQLTTDFAATGNVAVIEGIERLLAKLRTGYTQIISSGLRTEVSGSAAFGADMLRAAEGGVRKTEVITVVLVLLILGLVYRAPFLVAIPLASIAVSLMVSLSVISLLARTPGEAVDTTTTSGLGVFTTTRIFVVVLLFGAGTDLCLFFLARNRELLEQGHGRSRREMRRVIARSWQSVHNALVTSALTTIVGLAMMWFSDFEKFQFSGPIIAISLAITLCVCLTLTPALLAGLGQLAFWPVFRPETPAGSERKTSKSADGVGKLNYWRTVSDWIASSPGLALGMGMLLLGLPALFGIVCMGRVTYDLTEELSASSASRRGAALVATFFPAREGSPVNVLVRRQEPFASFAEYQLACDRLSAQLQLDGVHSIRSLRDPLGEFPIGKPLGMFAEGKRRLLAGNRFIRQRYVSSVPDLELRIARFDLVLSDNPFSVEADETIERIKDSLRNVVSQPASAWYQSELAFTGTAVGISDLRSVTQADQRRIQLLVTLGVWAVLVLLLRRLVLATYLILTVLLSYFATLGMTYWFFSTWVGEGYVGLDWKVPIFLFVILVAVGQDYNVYLVTRIFEEHKTMAMAPAIRRALEQTGGIITSCGFVMAGTFGAMMSPAVLQWLDAGDPSSGAANTAPVLRGITELGFALSLGVLLDTLVVRTILVPSFMLAFSRDETLQGAVAIEDIPLK